MSAKDDRVREQIFIKTLELNIVSDTRLSVFTLMLMSWYLPLMHRIIQLCVHSRYSLLAYFKFKSELNNDNVMAASRDGLAAGLFQTTLGY